MSRQQTGYIFRKGRSWFGRWREHAIVGGVLVRRQRCEKLADYCDRYRCENDVRSLLDERLKAINEGKSDARSTMVVADFAKDYWLPWVRENCKPSTVAGYETLWERYLGPRLSEIALRDFRTVHVADFLAELHARHGLGRRTLQHLKSLLSGIFTFARNQGVLDSLNPVQGAMLPKRAAAPAEMHAATPDEVLAILKALANTKLEDGDAEIDAQRRLKAQAAVALMFFAGLRPGEARGVDWLDYDGKRLMVHRSVWHTHTSTPKTEESVKPVPVIEPLRSMLTQLQAAEGNPTSGPILRGPTGVALNLDNLSKRVVAPILKAAKLKWHGWYSLRRGVATTLAGISKDPLASKGLLRHASLATTERYYIKDVPENTLEAMNQLEALCNQRATAQPGRIN